MTRMGIGLVLVALALSGCEGMGTAAQSKKTQGAVMGGLLGAATGAVIGNQSDHAGAGAAIGAGLGALGGGIMGGALEEQEQRLERQTYPPATTAPVTTTTGRVKFSPVTGKEYPVGAELDTDDIIGLPARIIIQHKPGKDGRLWMRAREVLKAQQGAPEQAPSEAPF